MKTDIWKWLASAMIGALLSGVPAYFMLAASVVTPNEVRLIIEREYSPSWNNTTQEIKELRMEVAELQQATATIQAKLDMLIRKYNASLVDPFLRNDAPLYARTSLLRRIANVVTFKR